MIRRWGFAALLAALVSLPCLAALQPPAGSHLDQLGCGDCHPGTKDEATFTGVTLDCDKCHDPARNIHPIGTVPKKALPAGFALSPEGTILCRTCHKVHGGEAKHSYLADAPQSISGDRAAFCAVCHDSSNMRTNPHAAVKGDDRCTFCHIKVPQTSSEALSSIRMEVTRLCDFCHGATEKNHPKNVEASTQIPKTLPRDAKGGVVCITCHDPHGTTTTTHYIRPAYAKNLEEGKGEKPHKPDYYTCKACHNESNEKALRLPGSNLLYRGDIIVLCLSCHVTARTHHPTGVGIPEYMQERASKTDFVILLDEDSKITCYTCHTNQCDSGTFEMVEREYDPVTYKTDLCWNCHDPKEYAKVSPHVDDYRRCTYCHDSTPVKGYDPQLMAVPLMVCLHCHEVKPHPLGKPHLKEPTDIIKVDPNLPLSKEGRVVCVTCHNPHADPNGNKNRLRVADGKKMCGMCHWK